MSLLIASIPYAIIAIAWGVFMVKVSLLKWRWDQPPSYIRALVGILWPVWVLMILMYAIFGKVKAEDNID